jgi:hypothetical protein
MKGNWRPTEHARRSLRCAAVLMGAMALFTTARACEDIPLLELNPFRTVAPADATLRWPAHPRPSTYRVQVRLSHPEGPSYRTLDIQTTATELHLSPLPEQQNINVQALVSVGCGEARGIDNLLATPPLFTVTQASVCRLEHFEPQWQRSHRLAWAPLKGAQAYRVRVVTRPAPDMPTLLNSGNLPTSLQDLVEPLETQAAAIDLAEPLKTPHKLNNALLLVQPICQGKPGSPSAARLPPSASTAS